MQVELDQVYKRFIQSWIIQDFNYKFVQGKMYGIKGENGSGKSTLLKILSKAMPPSKGSVKHFLNNNELSDNQVFKHLAYYAAGDDLIEEYTASELFDHYSSFKSLNRSKAEFFQEVDLEKHRNKLIGTYSAGMRQRLALGFTLMANASLILLDEPSSYLDTKKKEWLYTLLKSSLSADKLIIIASNDDQDFQFCDEIIQMD